MNERMNGLVNKAFTELPRADSCVSWWGLPSFPITLAHSPTHHLSFWLCFFFPEPIPSERHPQPFTEAEWLELPPSFMPPSASKLGVSKIYAHYIHPGSFSKNVSFWVPFPPKFGFWRKGHRMYPFLFLEYVLLTGSQGHSAQGAQETTLAKHYPGLWSFRGINLWCVPASEAPHSLQDVML